MRKGKLLPAVKNEWDANVGARLLDISLPVCSLEVYKIITFALYAAAAFLQNIINQLVNTTMKIFKSLT